MTNMQSAKELPLDKIKKHIDEEHSRSPLATYLREIVYGGVDGIVTTFAVVAGFSGAQMSADIQTIPILSVLIFGFSNLFADASSMGLGNFLSSRADQDVFIREKKKEEKELATKSELQKQEMLVVLTEKGYSIKEAGEIADVLFTNREHWISVMMHDKLKMSNPLEDNSSLTALATFLSFIAFGAIPLAPYILFHNTPENLFVLSITFSFIALILLGILRWQVAKQSIIRSFLETLLIGIVSASVAYTVGALFKS